MDLIMKVFVIVIIAIAVLSGVLMIMNGSSGNQGQKPLNETTATQLVLTDLKASNPNATINILSITPSMLQNKSWNIVVSFAYNSTRPCPRYLTEAFDYPATGLAPTTYDIFTNYTAGQCKVFVATNSTTINVPEIAIATAFNANAVQKFISLNRYNETSAKAQLNGTVWVINYSAPYAGYYQYVKLNMYGKLIGNYTVAAK